MQFVACLKQRLLNGRMCFCQRVSQQRGGAFFVGTGSSMDIMNDITFMGNTVAYESLAYWVRLQYIAVIHSSTRSYTIHSAYLYYSNTSYPLALLAYC